MEKPISAMHEIRLSEMWYNEEARCYARKLTQGFYEMQEKKLIRSPYANYHSRPKQASS